MDSIANDITGPDYIVEGFPTIYFKPAFGAPMKYDKGREIADFITFIEENKYGAEKKDEEEPAEAKDELWELLFSLDQKTAFHENQTSAIK